MDNKPILFRELDNRIARERINLAQVWSAWIEAEDSRRHSYLGTLGFELRSGKEYLYRRIGHTGKSLGPRSAQTEDLLARFRAGRDENRQRLETLADGLKKQAAILRGLRDGRLPVVAARVLRELRIHGRETGLRVIGTNALYAYEALAGVVFDESATATGDIDLLQDDRRKLRLLSDDRQLTGLAQLICDRVDRSFRQRNKRDYRLTNNDGYMVELTRPEPRPAWRPMPGAEPEAEGDLVEAPVIGLQWLVNAPAIETFVVDEKGYPAPIRCPDPRYWAAHKLWLSQREDRDPIKKSRDAAQGAAVLTLVRTRLPHLPLDADFLTRLPRALAREIANAPPPAVQASRSNW